MQGLIFAAVMVQHIVNSNAVVSNCPETYCNRRGQCRVIQGERSCRCNPPFVGSRCEQEQLGAASTTLSTTVSTTVSTVSTVSTIEKPVEFIRHLENQTFTEVPSTVTFECELSKDNVDVQWQVGDQLIISSSSKFEISRNKTVHKLIIRRVEHFDIGKYVITELAGRKNSAAELIIEDGRSSPANPETTVLKNETGGIGSQSISSAEKGELAYLLRIVSSIVVVGILYNSVQQDDN